MSDEKSSTTNVIDSEQIREKEDMFDMLIKAACEHCFEEEFEEFANLDTSDVPPPSHRHKIRMNRLFRERVGGKFLPYPDVDNAFERLRSKIVIKLKINEFLDERKTKKYCR